MKVFKKGSKGYYVEKIQEFLKSLLFYVEKVDGDFGPQTESAVKKFQLIHKLEQDGIVGPQTWAKMFGGEMPMEEIEITKGYINTHISLSPNRKIRFIAIHYTAGSTSKKGAAMATRNVFLKRKASADFVVDDETILQINPDIRNYYTWNVGDKKNPYCGGGQLYGIATNRNTIGIEICSNLKPGASASAVNHEGWYYTDASINNAIRLVRYLMEEYNIPLSNVVRHYDVSGKPCPGVIGYNNGPIYDTKGKKTNMINDSEKWVKFKSMI